MTIDASVQMRGDHHVIVDPALPLKVSYDDFSKGSRIVRAEGDLNGGGELLRLRTVAGNIQLVLTDMDKQLQMYKQQMEKLKQQMDSLKGKLVPRVSGRRAAIRKPRTDSGGAGADESFWHRRDAQTFLALNGGAYE